MNGLLNSLLSWLLLSFISISSMQMAAKICRIAISVFMGLAAADSTRVYMLKSGGASPRLIQELAASGQQSFVLDSFTERRATVRGVTHENSILLSYVRNERKRRKE